MSEEMPTMLCPRCKVVEEDHDGFGVVHCARCGYCSHASMTEGRCDFCGQVMDVMATWEGT